VCAIDSAPEHGGRVSERFRKCVLWKYFAGCVSSRSLSVQVFLYAGSVS
jgi:hypothetical protein